MSPHRRSARIAAALMAIVAAALLGFAGGRVSIDAATTGDLEVNRRQGYDRVQCLVDYLSLDPTTRLEAVGGDDRLTVLCPAVQQLVRPDDPPPEVGLPPERDG